MGGHRRAAVPQSLGRRVHFATAARPHSQHWRLTRKLPLVRDYTRRNATRSWCSRFRQSPSGAMRSLSQRKAFAATRAVRAARAVAHQAPLWVKSQRQRQHGPRRRHLSAPAGARPLWPHPAVRTGTRRYHSHYHRPQAAGRRAKRMDYPSVSTLAPRCGLPCSSGRRAYPARACPGRRWRSRARQCSSWCAAARAPP